MIDSDDRHAIARALAATPGGVWVRCVGPSMSPTVPVGDRVRVRAAGALQVGDVILFETSDRQALVVHRVVWVMPCVPWIAHAGDAPDGQGVGFTHRSRVIARAELPRRLPTPSQWVAALGHALRLGVRVLARGPGEWSRLWTDSRAESPADRRETGDAT